MNDKQRNFSIKLAKAVEYKEYAPEDSKKKKVNKFSREYKPNRFERITGKVSDGIEEVGNRYDKGLSKIIRFIYGKKDK